MADSVGKDVCCICQDEVSERAITDPCMHVFDCECISRWTSGSSSKCPCCRTEVHNILFHISAESHEVKAVDYLNPDMGSDVMTLSMGTVMAFGPGANTVSVWSEFGAELMCEETADGQLTRVRKGWLQPGHTYQVIGYDGRTRVRVLGGSVHGIVSEILHHFDADSSLSTIAIDDLSDMQDFDDDTDFMDEAAAVEEAG